jgi:OmpA-OmpF porin, OOP family
LLTRAIIKETIAKGGVVKKLLFVAALIVASAASAQDKGFFIGGHIGQADAKSACDNLAGTGISCDSKDSSWKILGGYQFSRHFAAELGYTDGGSVTATFGSLREEIEASVFDLVAVGILPVVDRLAVYGKLGLYRAETEDTTNFGFSAKETNTDITYGFGVRYDFSGKFALRGEWQRYADVGGGEIGESDVDVISVGLLFRF